MNVTVQELSPVEKKVAVEIEWPLVAAKLDEAYRELGRGVTLKGFRKGKVPRNILERMFARQVEQDVVQKLLQESFVRAAQQHSLEPVAAPIVDDVQLDRGTAFRYSARIEVRAPIDPTNYDGVELSRPQPTITDEEIEQALQHKREELAEYRKVEGRDALGENDVAVVDVKGEIAGKPITREGVMVDMGDAAHDFIPGLGQALRGAPVSAKDHEVTLALPGGGDEAPKEARLKITVKEARERLMPALDDDFAKDTGEADTLEELRTRLRADLLAGKEKDVHRELREELVKELIRRNPFQVPPALVEQHTELLLQRARLGMAIRGIDPSQVQFDEGKAKDSLRGAAADEVRGRFLVDAISDKEKVEVSEAELEKKLAELAKDREKSVARLRAELQKDGRLEPIKHQLREEKTLDLLLTRAKITAKVGEGSPSEK